MKRLIPLTLLFALLLIPLSSHAQEEITDLAHVEVALWPDFDDASMLVLVTGTMPEGAELPADITFPLMDGYNHLVVARVTDDGNMIDDLEILETANSVTFSSPEPRFRIEYYVPYTEDDDQRHLDYKWESPVLGVDAFQVTVQRPAAATELTINPEAVGEVVGQSTGLTEYLLAEQPMPAGTSYGVTVDYGVNSRLLSVDLINDQSMPTANTGDEDMAETAVSQPTPEKDNTLIIFFGVLGVVLIAVAVTWYIATSSTARKTPARPKPARSKKKRAGAKKFCHECGSPMGAGAKFCANCGTAVKK